MTNRNQRRWCSILMGLMIWSMPVGLWAGADKSLTLKACIQLALEKNIQIIQAQNEREARKNEVVSAYGNFLPNLNLSGNWNRTQRVTKSDAGFVNVGGVSIPIPAQAASTTSNSYSSYLASNITLFNGFANYNNAASARASYQASDFSLKRAQQNVILNVHLLYFEVLRTEHLFKISQEKVAYSRQQLERIHESEKVGASSLADVYLQQAQLAQDELTQTQNENDFLNARADLMAYLTLNLGAEIEFHDPEIKTEIAPESYANYRQSLNNPQTMLEQAFNSRWDYKISQENVQVARHDLAASRSEFYPSVSGNFSYGLNSSELEKLGNNRNRSMGIGVSFPVFSRLQTHTRVQQAKISLVNREEELAEKERTIQVELQKAIMNLDAAYRAYESASKSVLYQNENLKIIQEKFNLGSSTVLDLVLATNNLNTAETARINATYQYLMAMKQIEYAFGTLSN